MTTSTFTVSPDGVAHFKRGDKPAAAPKKPKDRLGWLVKQGHISPEHLDLGERLLKLNEDKQREPSPHMHFDQGGGGGSGRSPAPLARASARQRWERQFAVAGPTGEALVSAIIIDGMALGDAAEHLNINPKAVLPMLRYTLDILART